MKLEPPKWPLLFLRWFCRKDYLEEIEGDLIEVFRLQHKQSPAKAKWQFIWNVIRHFRPSFIKPVRLTLHYNTLAMIRNYFKTAFRNLLRHKSYTFINAAGLSVGM